jgi:hypothetical protein
MSALLVDIDDVEYKCATTTTNVRLSATTTRYEKYDNAESSFISWCSKQNGEFVDDTNVNDECLSEGVHGIETQRNTRKNYEPR